MRTGAIRQAQSLREPPQERFLFPKKGRVMGVLLVCRAALWPNFAGGVVDTGGVSCVAVVFDSSCKVTESYYAGSGIANR